jgi:Gpi18-like mannosyltransferase
MSLRDGSRLPSTKQPREQLLVAAILLLAVVAVWAAPFVYVVPADYKDFLLPWYEHIASYGVVGSFAHPFSNYSPPYLYLLAVSTLLPAPPLVAIKGLAAVGSLWTVVAARRLLSAVGVRQPLEGSLLILLLPTTIINAPILAQADMFWVAPCLLAIAASYDDKTAAMAFWAGVGFAFKAQAIFLAPFVVAMLIKHRAPAWHWLIPVLVYLCAILPAWLAGWPLADLLTVYLEQARYVPPNGVRYVSTASNWWALFAYIDYDAALRSYWIGFLTCAGAALAYIAYYSRRTGSRMVAAAISATMLPFLLPGMHERFYALAEIIAFCLAWSSRVPRAGAVAALMQVQLVLAFFGWIFRSPLLTILGAALVAFCLWLLAGEKLARPVVEGEERRIESDHSDAVPSGTM